MALVLLAFTVLLWIATAIKLVQLVRAPDDRLLRTVAGGLGSAAIAFTVGRHPVEVWLDSVVVGLPSLIRNLGMIAAFFALFAFFVYSTAQQAHRGHELRRHRAVVGALIGLMVAAWATAPAQIRSDPRAAAHAGLLHGTAFQLLAVVALLYTISGALYYALRYARRAQRKHLRIGLRILVVGLAAALAMNLFSVTLTLLGIALPRESVAIIAQRLRYPMLVAIAVTIPGLVIGLAYPIVAGMVLATPRWWRH